MVHLALLGDIMLGRGVEPSSESFAYIQPRLAGADLALANLESPLTNAPVAKDTPYILCAAPENVNYLVEAGLDLLSVANNHREDCGAEGEQETLSTLEAAGLSVIGPGVEPVTGEVNGVRLAFLAFDDTGRWDSRPAVEAVRAAKRTGAVVVVAMHWGTEYQSGESEQQVTIAKELADAGADLIWGHHPHVLQPAKWIGQTLVLFSLGNALFDQYGLESTRQSALVLVTLNMRGVTESEAVPFVIDVAREPNRGTGCGGSRGK